MPGHVGTDILANTSRAHGTPEPEDMSDTLIEKLIPADARAALVRAGALAEGASSDDVRGLIARFETDFREKAPLTAAEAATIILDGVRSGAWRILVGEDAKGLDRAVRARPETAYDYAELAKTATQARASNKTWNAAVASSLATQGADDQEVS